MKKIAAAIILILAVSFTAFADIARPDNKPKPDPKPAKQVESNMVIRLDPTITEAKLIVPKSQLKQLKAELEALDNEDDDNTASAATGTQRLQTIVGGTFLSLAFVFGGFWFVKRNGKGAAAIGLLTAVIGSAGAVSLVYANIGPPPSARKITSKIFDANVIRYSGYVTGKVKVEAGTSDRIELLVPEERAESDGTK